MKTCIENILPPEFNHMMGQYVQICAHIEKTCWLILAQLRNVDWSNVEAVSDLVKIRKKTPNLIEELRKGVSLLSDDLARDLEWCIDQIELGLERRHMAIHGAWSAGPTPNTYRVDYFVNLGTSKAPQWAALFKTDFSIQELEEVVRDAECILLTAGKVNSALIKLKSKTPSTPEAAGAEFIPANGGGPGAKLRKP